MKRDPLTTIALVLLSALPALAQPQKAAPAIDLKDGDTLVFLGDSITHQCLYTQYVEDFFYTRYPDRRVRFHNAGVSGDKAADAIARFDEDVAALKPKYVTLLLGMNDGQYEPFKEETFAAYAVGMSQLLDRIAAIGATPIVLSPTNFDHRQLALRKQDPAYRFRERPFDPNYNCLLAYFGGWLRERAGDRGFPFVDLWGPLNDATFDLRQAGEPDFTLVPDAIHPGGAGQFIMAYELLSNLTPDRRAVSAINIVPAANGKWRGSGAGEILGLAVSEAKDRVEFTFLAPALPWVVPEQPYAKDEVKWECKPYASLGYRLTSAGHRLSNERLRIAGLAPGNYQIHIDDRPAGKPVSHLTLGAKVELQSWSDTPQYQQALRVAELNRERNTVAILPLRDAWGQVKRIRKKFESDPDGFATAFGQLRPQIEKLKALAAEFDAKIYETAKPVPRRYAIIRVQ